jgi:exosortase
LRWGPSLLVLALLPLSEQLARVLPEQPLSHLTARLCQALLLLGGVDAAAAGRQVTLSGGSVLIADTCAGIDVIAQLLVIAVVFVLAFPLPLRRSRWLLLALAPLLALLGNAFRIALLALISASQWPNKDWWFGFFHEESGSLMFSGLSVAVFGWIYMAVLERQLQARERRI